MEDDVVEREVAAVTTAAFSSATLPIAASRKVTSSAPWFSNAAPEVSALPASTSRPSNVMFGEPAVNLLGLGCRPSRGKVIVLVPAAWLRVVRACEQLRPERARHPYRVARR